MEVWSMAGDERSVTGVERRGRGFGEGSEWEEEVRGTLFCGERCCL